MKIYFILIVITFLSCSEEKPKELTSTVDTNFIYKSMNTRSRTDNELEAAVLNNGDIDAYKDLKVALLEYPLNEGEIKGEFFAKIMADKYHYPQAYRDVFQYIATCNDSTLDCLSKIKKDSAIYYLKTAIKMGDSSAIELAKEYNIKY